ncbi:MAG: hypothetical protein KAI26_07050 [Nanoarchaeota archaeon]|nr:hypothetical protein [Nanoarchaeota archaeon]
MENKTIVSIIDDSLRKIEALGKKLKNIKFIGVQINEYTDLKYAVEQVEYANIIFLDHEMGSLKGYELMESIREINPTAEVISYSDSVKLPKNIYNLLGVDNFKRPFESSETLNELIENCKIREQKQIDEDTLQQVKVLEKENDIEDSNEIKSLVNKYDSEAVLKFKELKESFFWDELPPASVALKNAYPIMHDLFYRVGDVTPNALEENIHDIVRIMCDAYQMAKDTKDNIVNAMKSGRIQEEKEFVETPEDSSQYLSHMNRIPEVLEKRYRIKLGDFYKKNPSETMEILVNRKPIT